MTEMEKRESRLVEVTGQSVSILHSKSILQNMLDPDTMKHCAQYITVGSDPEEYSVPKAKIMEFIHLVGRNRLSQCDQVFPLVSASSCITF